MNKNFMWTYLLQLGANMWNEENNFRGRDPLRRSTAAASPVLRFDRKLWDEYILELKNAGVNTLIIDLGEAMRFESHPELAVLGSWTQEQMRAEVERLRDMGFEVVPKLNFSACHDTWLGEYSRMLSTSIYYRVCADVIHETCEVFKPKYFHIGMDEETANHQRNQLYCVCRQHELWWNDFYYLVSLVEHENVRAWIWSDYIWNHEEDFLRKMPKSVIQSNWYYGRYFENASEDYKSRFKAFDTLFEHGYDQVPTGSAFSCRENMEEMTRYCYEQGINGEHLLGFMQTAWERIEGPWMPLQHTCAETLAAAKKWFEAQK